MATDGDRTLDLDEAAAFLHISKAVLRERARRGIVPAAKPGKRWVFLAADLAGYLRSLYAAGGQAPRSDASQEKSLCEYSKAVIPGGFALRRAVESEYAALLGLRTRSKPGSTKTG